jgi:hypothetical protein
VNRRGSFSCLSAAPLKPPAREPKSVAHEKSPDQEHFSVGELGA